MIWLKLICIKTPKKHTKKLSLCIPAQSLWIFPGAQLKVNGPPGYIQGNLRGMFCIMLGLSCNDPQRMKLHVHSLDDSVADDNEGSHDEIVCKL